MNTQASEAPDAGPDLAGMFKTREPKGYLAPPWGIMSYYVAGHLNLHGHGDKPRLFQGFGRLPNKG